MACPNPPHFLVLVVSIVSLLKTLLMATLVRASENLTNHILVTDKPSLRQTLKYSMACYACDPRLSFFGSLPSLMLNSYVPSDPDI